MLEAPPGKAPPPFSPVVPGASCVPFSDPVSVSLILSSSLFICVAQDCCLDNSLCFYSLSLPPFPPTSWFSSVCLCVLLTCCLCFYMCLSVSSSLCPAAISSILSPSPFQIFFLINILMPLTLPQALTPPNLRLGCFHYWECSCPLCDLANSYASFKTHLSGHDCLWELLLTQPCPVSSPGQRIGDLGPHVPSSSLPDFKFSLILHAVFFSFWENKMFTPRGENSPYSRIGKLQKSTKGDHALPSLPHPSHLETRQISGCEPVPVTWSCHLVSAHPPPPPCLSPNVSLSPSPLVHM